MIKNFINVIKNYSDFKGRASRSEFWYFFLAQSIIAFVLAMIDTFMGNEGLLSLSNLFALFIAVPFLAVGARRLHDTNKSGWLQLLFVIPLLGYIVLIVLWCIESNEGSNRYGISPHSFEAFLAK